MAQAKKTVVTTSTNKTTVVTPKNPDKKFAQPTTSKSTSAPQEGFLKRSIPYIVIFLVGLGIYLQTFWFEFTGLDDSFFLVVYSGYFADIRNFMRGFKESGVLDYYRPLLFGTMILDFQVSKTNPWFYHITNVLYHCLTCMVLYRMLLKLKFDKTMSFLTTLIFTTHPLWTMGVAWVPGRNDPLITLMIIGSFNYLINFLERQRLLDVLLHWVLFAAALYTKETSALFPFVCCFYFLLLTKYLDLIKPIMIVGVGWAIIGLVWFAIRAEALELANKNGTRFTHIIYGDSWIYNLPVIAESIGKLLIPVNLSNFPKFTALSTWLGIGVLSLWVAAVVFVKNQNWKMIAFSMLWFSIFLGPSISFVFADSGRYDYLEHRIYLPALGFIILMNEIIRAFFVVEDRQKYFKFFQYGLGAMVVAYSGVTIVHSLHFKNPENFWKKAIEGAPLSSQVYRGMGKVYYDAGDLPKAEVNFMSAVSLNRAEVNTISDLGKAYENKNDLESAMRCYMKTLSVDSNNVMFLTDMARIHEKKGDMAGAEKYYKKVVLRDGNFWQAKFGLGVIAYQKQDFLSAEQYWLDVARINPGYNDTFMNLAVLYFFTKRYDKALENLDILRSKGVNVDQLNPGLVNQLEPYRKKG
ncbi:MAG: tetratricopeptide repeat protein [Cytophagales bacterium]|nr:tetratricopeptide repeat protein [Cytophagales bacterium]